MTPERDHDHGHDNHPEPKFDAASWDERYREKPLLWSGRPNAVLTQEVTELAPGRALDVGCGEGADSIWLAQRGWQVVGVDVSQVALERAADHAAKAGTAALITWQQRDLLAWEPPSSTFDLVSAQFFHLMSINRSRVYGGLADAVAPGGTLLVVAHHPSDLDTTMARPRFHDMFFTADELAGELEPEEWEILTSEARPRTATDPEGREITISDTVLKARRIWLG
ncbi:MAG: putative reductase [Marmoricola sp.]|nr:putative reductase [Marmoricola sp.]